MLRNSSCGAPPQAPQITKRGRKCWPVAFALPSKSIDEVLQMGIDLFQLLSENREHRFWPIHGCFSTQELQLKTVSSSERVGIQVDSAATMKSPTKLHALLSTRGISHVPIPRPNKLPKTTDGFTTIVRLTLLSSHPSLKLCCSDSDPHLNQMVVSMFVVRARLHPAIS